MMVLLLFGVLCVCVCVLRCVQQKKKIPSWMKAQLDKQEAKKQKLLRKDEEDEKV